MQTGFAFNAGQQCDAREAGLACGFFCLQDYRSGSVITAVIQLEFLSNA